MKRLTSLLSVALVLVATTFASANDNVEQARNELKTAFQATNAVAVSVQERAMVLMASGALETDLQPAEEGFKTGMTYASIASLNAQLGDLLVSVDDPESAVERYAAAQAALDKATAAFKCSLEALTKVPVPDDCPDRP